MAVVLVIAGSAAADDEAPERQTSSITDTEGHFSFVSTSTDFKQNDRFDVEFDNGQFDMSYEADLTTATSQDWELEITFDQLVSYKDNGNGYLDSGDSVVSSIDLRESSYSLSTSVADTHGGFGKQYITATREEGVLSLEFIVTQRETTVDSLLLLPTEVKLNISINGMELGEGANHIALKMGLSVDSNTEVQYNQFDDLGELNLTTSSAGGYLRWADSALVDGQPSPVKATWDGEHLVFSYSAGDSVKHDPVLGVISLAAQSGLVVVKGNTQVFAVGLLLASAAVGCAVVLSMRRRKS